ncbi:MAG: thymidine kinase [Bacilli bacterium]|nr:thymidine kinase [Bacilli bacterium]
MANRGKIELICGPMFSGKSTELIRLVDRLTIAGEHCVIFKPRIDDRYVPSKVCTHSKIERECVVIEKSSEILEYLSKNREISVVAVDEAQFFDDQITNILEQLSNAGYDILIAGLDKDFRGEPFGPMRELVCLAEYVYKLTAVCNVCGEEATYTQRIIGGVPADYNSEIIVVGERDTYQARCRNHHEVPSKPGISEGPARQYYRKFNNRK